MKRVFVILFTLVIVASLAGFAGCSGGDKTTTPNTSELTTTAPTTTAPTTTAPTTTAPTTTAPTTTAPTTTAPTTTEPTTTEPTTSEPGGEPTAEDAPAITNHAVGPGYDGLCMICHALGGTDPIPDDGYHETYDASTDECYDCHKEG